MEMLKIVRQRRRSITPIQMMRKMKVVMINPKRSTMKAKKARINTPRRGLSQALWGQKGVDGLPLFHLLNINRRERKMRRKASPKGRNPGPGCLNFPIERWTELHAVATPMMRRI